MTRGGLHIPTSAQGTKVTDHYRVEAVGPGRRLPKGGRAPMTVAVGQRVFGRWRIGCEISVDGVVFRVAREGDILAARGGDDDE